MNNWRFIIFFLVGIAACVAGMWGLAVRARVVASDTTRQVLCPVDPATVDGLSVARGGGQPTRLARAQDGRWRIVAPYSAAADDAPVARLLDVATLTPIEDMRSEDELRQLDESLADFGLRPPCATVTLTSGGHTNTLHFGAFTASGREVYARVEGLMNVFTLAADAFAAVPSNADAFRPRALLACPPDEIAGIEFRMPDAPPVRLVREGTTWKITAPSAAPADAAVVATLLERLASAQIGTFTLPSAAQPQPAGTSPDGVLPTAALAPYGLAADAALSVTVRGADGSSESILFGGVSGTNSVWALVRNGTAVVTVDAALAELCRTREAAFRDTRAFTFASDEKLLSVSLSTGDMVYVLGRDTNGVWRLETPVVAPADQSTAAALVDKILKIKQSDIVPAGNASAQKPVHVALTTTASTRSGVAVPVAYFGKTASLADLRSKTMLTLEPTEVRRLSSKRAKAAEIAVTYDPARAAWSLEKPVEGRRSNPTAIKSVLTALARVEAVSVETVAATPADFRRCGLDAPSCIIAVDIETTGTTRRNILLGGATSGGGRYATVGGVDAVFVIAKQTAAALMTDLTE